MAKNNSKPPPADSSLAPWKASPQGGTLRIDVGLDDTQRRRLSQHQIQVATFVPPMDPDASTKLLDLRPHGGDPRVITQKVEVIRPSPRPQWVLWVVVLTAAAVLGVIFGGLLYLFR